MLFILRKSQLPLFAMPVHVAGGYRKDGTYVKPHMRTAHVAMKPHEQGHLFGAPPAAPAAAKKTPKLDKFLAKHGGEARMRSTLMEMRPEQRAKLIDAMAHIDDIASPEVVERLGMNVGDLKSVPPEPVAQDVAEPVIEAAEEAAAPAAEKPTHEIVEHTTGKGKVLRGVVRTDLSGHEAAAIDPYTFRKNGGWFIREKHLDVGASAAPTAASKPKYEPGEEEKRAENAAAVDKSKEQAAKLREGGEKLKASAEADLSRQRLSNTARRARMAAGADEEARKRLAIAGTMINLADAIESGEARHLKGISTRAAVESLDSSVRSAMIESDRGLSYQQQLERKGRAPEPDDIRNAKIYRPAWGNGGANKSDLIAKLQGKRGAKPLIERLRASNGPDGEMVKDLKKFLSDKDISYGLGWWNVEQVKKVDRLARLGITNDHELRLALAEYLVFRDGVKKEDPIKAAERALVGKKVGVDFFPTPKPLAATMAEMAGIKPGMTVLEPSAGNGHLADAARAAGATVDAVEISSALKDVLRAKGHNIVGDDFESFDPGKQYDAVIMNPPFSDRKDAAHIMRAYDMLKPGGKLVAIAGEGVFFGSDQRAQAFRSWLDERGADIEKLPENTFKGSDLPAQTGANARMLVVEKPAAVAATPAPAEKPMKNYGWDAVKLADAYSMDELGKLRAQVEAEHANPFDEKNRYTENGKSTLNLYDKKGMKKLEALSWAVTYKLQEKRAAADAGPKDGDRNADGLIFRDGRWHREEDPGSPVADAAAAVVESAAEPVPSAAPAMPTATNPDVELAEDREDLADELARDPHSEKAKALVKRVAERVAARDDPEDVDNPNSPNYRYADTGHIAGSRKEQAAAQVITLAKKEGARVYATAVDWSELEQNPREAKELITKSNLFGTVDWHALRDAGLTPGAGFLIDRIYASIGQEPSKDTPQARQDYAVGLQSLRDRLEACKTPAEVTSVLDNLREEFEGTILTAAEAEQYQALSAQASVLWDEARAIDDANDALYKKQIKARSDVYAIESEADKRKRRGWAPKPEHEQQLATLRPIAEAADKAWGDALQASRPRKDELDRLRSELGHKREVIKLMAKVRNETENPLHRAWNIMGDRFLGVIRYRSHKGSDAFANHVAAAKTGKVDWSWMDKETTRAPRVSKESARFQLQVADSSERIGGRAVAPQSTAELKEMFNLRDVQSGNWVLRDVASAKFHTEQCAGAFADLADLLGAEDAQVSLNGRLAMAFGARGHGAKGWADGAARAHYEPVQRVINLTKMGGGGSLAHEWFHALDNMAKEAEGGGASGKDDYVTQMPDLLPPGELRDAVTALRSAMLDGPHYAMNVETYSARDVPNDVRPKDQGGRQRARCCEGDRDAGHGRDSRRTDAEAKEAHSRLAQYRDCILRRQRGGRRDRRAQRQADVVFRA
jgi:protein-L-isoaspartate O-methyltransferase